MNNIIAIIPARCGSKSIKDKNIKFLSGHPLLAYSVAAAKLSNKIERVIVSTNSIKYAEIAKKYGAEVPFIRPDVYSTDTSTDRDFLVHAINWLNNNDDYFPEYLVHLRPTTPLREVRIIEKAIDMIQHNPVATSLRSGHKAPESPFKWLRRDGNYFKGLLDKEEFNLPKENFSEVYIPDGYIDILRASFLVENDTIHGDKMIAFESPVCTEVDSPEEFSYLQYQINKDNSDLLDYLDSIVSKKNSNY
jgi:CMP-N,N'-diacetyllegionaminic acid synthase